MNTVNLKGGETFAWYSSVSKTALYILVYTFIRQDNMKIQDSTYAVMQNTLL